ncbi:hypothetical protein BDN72DRAFT_819245 [Pluteus cervinus]|uniref:Uncharacterized protein n=1 Tax=Pluteus cervinus TaxID=181527 RepID=A0ACD3AWW6_9AGAR|nr:hypothetical protein BDN72DRAFT_819245 [Pluteus cervinus]
MFSLPQPDQLDETEMLDGHPIVVLQDTIEDIVDVLRVLYQPFYFDKLPSNADLGSLVKFISGILRISTKYSMRILRQKCIAILQSKFPSTLAGCERASEVQYSSETVLAAIPLAREANIPGILPWAFYIAAHMPHEKLIKDTTLSWRDKALCLAGKERLWEAFKTHTHFFLFEVPRVTSCQVGCAMRASQSKAMDWNSAERMRSGPNPLEPYSLWNDLRLCPACLKHMEAKHYEGRSKLWEQLPTYFMLGTWEDIKREQES